MERCPSCLLNNCFQILLLVHEALEGFGPKLISNLRLNNKDPSHHLGQVYRQNSERKEAVFSFNALNDLPECFRAEDSTIGLVLLLRHVFVPNIF